MIAQAKPLEKIVARINGRKDNFTKKFHSILFGIVVRARFFKKFKI